MLQHVVGSDDVLPLVLSPTGQPWRRQDGAALNRLYTQACGHRWALSRLRREAAGLPREAVSAENAAIAPPVLAAVDALDALAHDLPTSAIAPGPLADPVAALRACAPQLAAALDTAEDWSGDPATAQPGRLVTALDAAITALDAVEAAVLALADQDSPHPMPNDLHRG